MSFLVNQTVQVLRDSKNRLGSLAKASYLSARGYQYDPIEYFISTKHKLVYVVNCKCACSSIKKVLLANNDIILQNEKYTDIHTEGFKKGFSTTNTVFDDNSFYFSFVRNPFDRMISLYRNKFLDLEKMEMTGFLYDIYLGGLFKQDDNFETFLRKIKEVPVKMADKHFKSQHQLLYIESPKIDFVGKLESFDTDFSNVCDKFNLTRPHVSANKTTNATKEVQYNKKTFDLVAEHFAKDIEFFGYKEAADALYKKL